MLKKLKNDSFPIIFPKKLMTSSKTMILFFCNQLIPNMLICATVRRLVKYFKKYRAWFITPQKQPLEVFYGKKYSWKFRKFHKKTLVPVSFLIKLQVCNFIKKETLAQVFSREFWEIFKHTVFTEHLRTIACDPCHI